MIYYDRIDVYEGTDINKTSKSKACGSFHHWRLSNNGCNFQPNVSNRCHDSDVITCNASKSKDLCEKLWWMIKDDDFLERHNTIWDKISVHIKSEFDSEPVCNNFF